MLPYKVGILCSFKSVVIRTSDVLDVSSPTYVLEGGVVMERHCHALKVMT